MEKLHEEELVKQIQKTNQLIEKLQQQKYLTVLDNPWRFFGYGFLQGLAVALGSTVGLAIVLAFVAFVLRRLEVFAPISDQLNHIQQALDKLNGK